MEFKKSQFSFNTKNYFIKSYIYLRILITLRAIKFSSMKRIICILLISAFYAIAGANSKYETGYTFTNISINNGQLPGANVVAILNDGNQIWFGTRSGIALFSENDRRIWNYPVISHDSICQDSAGVIWITTDNGIYIYDAKAVDLVMVQDDGGQFCCAVGNEVCVYSSNRLMFFPAGGGKIIRSVEFESDIDVMSMAELPDGKILLGNYNEGLYKYDQRKGGLQLFSNEKIPNIRRIRSYEGVIYALSYGNGVYRYSSGGTPLGKIEGLGSDFVTDLAFYDGKIWICTDGDGIYILDPVTNDFSQLRHIQGDIGSFPTNALTTLYYDAKYGLWAGTVHYGACNISKRFIHTYSDALPGSSRGLSERCVVSILTDEEKCCWIGTDGQGINRYDFETESFRHYPSTYGYAIPSICRYDDRQLLATIFNKGLFLFDTVSASLKPFTGIDKAVVDGLFQHGDYPLLFSPHRDRIFLFANNSYIYNPVSGDLNNLTYENGKILSGTMPSVWYNEDFLMLSRKESILANRYDDEKMHYLCKVPSGPITAISYDSVHSCIWVATDRSEIGFFHFDATTFTASSYTRLEALNLTNVSTLTSDSKGRLWITTGNSLYMYDRGANIVKKFSNYDGYERNDILIGTSTLSNSDIFYVAGSSGLVMVNSGIADEIGLSDPPAIRLEEIENAGHIIPAGSISSGKTVKLPWKKGRLLFKYVVSGMHFQEEVEIKYTVLGEFESEMTTTNRTLNLSSLSPGQYTIKAECFWSGGSLSGAETIRLKILPPWYKSALFQIALIIMLLGAIVLLMLKFGGKYLGGSDKVSERDKDFLRRFCEYVALNLDQDLSSGVLTQELGISRTSLFEKVKALTGYSLNDYVKRMRIEKAMALLKDSEMNINEISDAVGFAYPRYFSTVFKEETGESPTEYRKKHLAGK